MATARKRPPKADRCHGCRGTGPMLHFHEWGPDAACLRCGGSGDRRDASERRRAGGDAGAGRPDRCPAVTDDESGGSASA